MPQTRMAESRPVEADVPAWGELRSALVHGLSNRFVAGPCVTPRPTWTGASNLFVAISNPDASLVLGEGDDPDGHRPQATPFTYQGRAWMVTAARESILVGG